MGNFAFSTTRATVLAVLGLLIALWFYADYRFGWEPYNWVGNNIAVLLGEAPERFEEFNWFRFWQITLAVPFTSFLWLWVFVEWPHHERKREHPVWTLIILLVAVAGALWNLLAFLEPDFILPVHSVLSYEPPPAPHFNWAYGWEVVSWMITLIVARFALGMWRRAT